MNGEKGAIELGDKKSYAGIPEAEFVVSIIGYLNIHMSLIHTLKGNNMIIDIWTKISSKIQL